ncbi:MAG: nitrite/sulfite reductase [Terriglobia bacterium]
MKVSNPLWKEKLGKQIPEDLGREIDIFETEILLRKQGKLEEKLFAETRLRRGVYGQRYDNGQRHSGKEVRQLQYAADVPTKGPSTLWDAPGMQRIKIPFGGVRANQLETLADLAEEFSDGIVHVTTRQDFQLHFVHIENTPTIMRRLAAVGITTREACGNSVRNVTACPFSGVCTDEAFDVSPYAKGLSKFLLGHPDCQDFGRKFKPSFSGCYQHACGLTSMHDLGLLAVTHEQGGEVRKGFKVFVGGGLGPVPYQAKIFDEFLPVEELLPITQAIARVFARLGEKKNRNRARLKFLVHEMGIEKFRDVVLEERKILPHDPRWTELFKQSEEGVQLPALTNDSASAPSSPDFRRWLNTNVKPQRQDGYSLVTITLPLGDITSSQLRGLADIVREFTPDTIRTSVEQNFVMRWVGQKELPRLYLALDKIGLAAPGAGAIVDVVACPGTDTCKLGISSSRGLAAELRNRLGQQSFKMDEAIQNLHIKISGCFNSCGQHHISDLGFYGVSRKIAGYTVPHFQVVLGGEWTNNAASYGLPMVAIPSKNIPEAVSRICEYFVSRREKAELFKDFIKRVGKAEIRTLLDDLSRLPGDQTDRTYFSDWGDPREYSVEDIAKGECAGEVVSSVEFDLAGAEREVFEAQLLLEQGKIEAAGKLAYDAMVHAAKALIRYEFLDIREDSDEIVKEFRRLFYDTERFFDPIFGGRFAHYLFGAHEKKGYSASEEVSHQLIEEAQLFIEASHNCYARIGSLSTQANTR